jgi:hypothetical protein
MRWRTWTVATGAGALVAWSLGMIPSTLLSLSADSSESAGAADPSDATVYALAFLMGLLLGPVLGFAQWLVLRRFVRKAGLWMPANALAWAFGMVVIFVGAGAVAEGGMGARTVVLIVALLACAGAVVGSVHGLALVRLLGMTRSGAAR